MRRALTTLSITALSLAFTAQMAMADDGHDGGEGWWGETNDLVVTYFGFILIGFFPLFVLLMSLLQGRLDKRKDARKKAAKARAARAGARGGW
jgi:hypothetical protein